MTVKPKEPQLRRGLSLLDSTALLIGTIIGTGIFLKASVMSQTLGSPLWVLGAWVMAGLLSLAGALTYAELGCLFPRAGGEYVYLREAYGDGLAFLFGWMRFWIGGPGSVAAFAVASASFFKAAFQVGFPFADKVLAVFFIWFFTGLHCLSVSIGGKVITAVTSIKLFLIMALPLGIFFFSGSSSWGHLLNSSASPVSFSTFGSAMVAALWAFDGWNNLPMMAGEVQNPQSNIPRALSLGTGSVLFIYGLVNLGYFLALPLEDVVTSASKLYPSAPPVAAKAAQTFLGPQGFWWFSIMMVVSALGAMNGSVLSSSRVPFALAKDGLFPQFLARVSHEAHVPFGSLLIQGGMATVLALSGSFDQLTDYVVFASWIFYALVAYSVFIFRRKMPLAPRAYRTLGYPVVPILFIGVSTFLMVNTLIHSWRDSLMGLLFITSGIPVYYFFHRHKK